MIANPTSKGQTSGTVILPALVEVGKAPASGLEIFDLAANR